MHQFFTNPPFVAKTDLRHPGLKPWLDRAKITLGEVHPGRQNEWALSRFALEQRLLELSGITALDKEFDGYQRLKDLPDWIFSLSHTKEWAGAWVLPSQHCAGLGLDLELKSRKISHEVFQRMHHPDDMNLDLAVLWAVKEAAYKSLPVDIQDLIWLNSIKVKRGTFEVRGHTAHGVWNIFPHEHLVVAAAVLLA